MTVFSDWKDTIQLYQSPFLRQYSRGWDMTAGYVPPLEWTCVTTVFHFSDLKDGVQLYTGKAGLPRRWQRQCASHMNHMECNAWQRLIEMCPDIV